MEYKTFSIFVFLLFFYVVERWKPYDNYPRRSFLVNASMGLASFILSTAVIFFISSHMDIFSIRIPSFVDFLMGLLVLDFLSFIWHFSNHYFTPLWYFHRCHHSELHLEASTAFRFHFVETTLALAPKLFAILFFKFSLPVVVVFEIVFQASNIFQHSNVRLPKKIERILSLIVVTPTIHRKHHDQDPDNQKKNLSTIFCIWDRIFRTYRDNSCEATKSFGLRDIRYNLTFMAILKLPFSKGSGAEE